MIVLTDAEREELRRGYGIPNYGNIEIIEGLIFKNSLGKAEKKAESERKLMSVYAKNLQRLMQNHPEAVNALIDRSEVKH